MNLKRWLLFFHEDSPDFADHPDPEGAAWARALFAGAILALIGLLVQARVWELLP